MRNEDLMRTVKLNLAFMLFILLISINVTALGVAPSREMLDYDTAQHTINIRIVNNEHKDMDVRVYAQGELADYVTISKSSMHISSGEEEALLSYDIKLPEGLSPGTKDLSIIIMESSDTASNQDASMILSQVSVAHQLKVNVPYAGTFAEGVLYISEANVDESVEFTANIINRGDETIQAIQGELVIRGPTNQELYRIRSNSLNNLQSRTSDKLLASWSTENPGTYYAEFIVNYDSKQFVLRKTFMVGNYNVDIKSMTVKDFKLGTVAKFDIDVVNNWNEPLDNVYGEVHVLDNQGNIVNTFRTGAVELDSLTSSKVTAYWDTEGVDVGSYDIKVVMHYAGKTTEKIFKAVVAIDNIKVIYDAPSGNVVAKDPSEKGSANLLVILIIILVCINIAWFVYFKFLKKKDI